jgi:hypothetical protein
MGRSKLGLLAIGCILIILSLVGAIFYLNTQIQSNAARADYQNTQYNNYVSDHHVTDEEYNNYFSDHRYTNEKYDASIAPKPAKLVAVNLAVTDENYERNGFRERDIRVSGSAFNIGEQPAYNVTIYMESNLGNLMVSLGTIKPESYVSFNSKVGASDLFLFLYWYRVYSSPTGINVYARPEGP